jgi:hypothetical protein
LISRCIDSESRIDKNEFVDNKERLAARNNPMLELKDILLALVYKLD